MVLSLTSMCLAAATVVTTSGYVDTRTFISHTRLDGAPGLVELAEANVQLKIAPSETFTVQADASLFWQGAWLMQGGERDTTQYRPQIVLSELYVDGSPHPHLRLLLGKKRIVWGSGMAFNPTDVLNPPKDPTDPSFQRAGAWLGMVEVPFEKVTFSLAVAGKVTRQYAGLPTALVVSPAQQSVESTRGWVPDDRDDDAHWALSGRVYALIKDTDVTASYAFTNLYNDSFRNKSRFGLSLSRTFGALELHFEGMLQAGASHFEVNGTCDENPMACLAAGQPVVFKPQLNATWLNGKALGGGRYQFNDDSLLSLEYYFNGEGLSPDGFQRLAHLARAYPQVVAMVQAASVDPGAPQKLAFDPLRRHYVVLSFSKPRIFDDWTLSASALVGLEDLSFQVVPQVSWAPREWLQLTVAAYVPFSGVPAWGADVGDGQRLGEFGLSGFGTRVMVQARAFY